jgi:hypothetical protein
MSRFSVSLGQPSALFFVYSTVFFQKNSSVVELNMPSGVASYFFKNGFETHQNGVSKPFFFSAYLPSLTE